MINSSYKFVVKKLNKERLSITISPMTDQLLNQICMQTGETKSAITEKALKSYIERKLESDLKQLSREEFTDLADEETWLAIQNEIL